VIAYLLTVILAQIVFASFPGIDLAVSRAFANGADGFAWAKGSEAVVSLVIRRIGEAVSLLLVGTCIFGVLTGRLRPDDVRALAYPALTVILASGMVNLLLKAKVGRARPDHLVEFGGQAQFSPAWQIVAECDSNCSFTSGEVAMAAGLAIPVLVLFWPQLVTRRSRIRAVLLAAGYVLVVSLLRIGLGRHFLSDAVFSALLAGAAALILYSVLRIDEARWRMSRFAPVELARRLVAERQARRSGVRRRLS
jgi:membrane-associated phospholipid phosphatase